MVFDFAARPPEVNSTLIYSGAGAGPMMAAASTFSTLSSELGTNAAAYESVISAATGSDWTGPSATAAAAAAQQNIEWLNTTSAQLQEAAAKATASAAAYEAAFSATIPPPVVYANRAQLAALVATNILGQNTPAIAANEAMYGEFWAQDATALTTYAANAAAAAQVTPLTEPTQSTNPGGAGAQAAAVEQRRQQQRVELAASTGCSAACRAHRVRPPPRRPAPAATPLDEPLQRGPGLLRRRCGAGHHQHHQRHAGPGASDDGLGDAAAFALRCRRSVRCHHRRRHPPRRRSGLRHDAGGLDVRCRRRRDVGRDGLGVRGRRDVGAGRLGCGRPGRRGRSHVGGHAAGPQPSTRPPPVWAAAA